ATCCVNEATGWLARRVTLPASPNPVRAVHFLTVTNGFAHRVVTWPPNQRAAPPRPSNETNRPLADCRPFAAVYPAPERLGRTTTCHRHAGRTGPARGFHAFRLCQSRCAEGGRDHLLRGRHLRQSQPVHPQEPAYHCARRDRHDLRQPRLRTA